MRLKSNGSCNLTGAKATCASVNSLGSAVYNSLNLSDVGLPGSVSLAVGVGYVAAKGNALAADAALCHFNIPPSMDD